MDKDAIIAIASKGASAAIAAADVFIRAMTLAHNDNLEDANAALATARGRWDNADQVVADAIQEFEAGDPPAPDQPA
jgi:hypothetical protein